MRAVLVLVAVLVGRVAGFNLDTSYPVVFQGDQRGSYYGYSVALRDLGAGNYRLVVGAPRSNSSFQKQRDIRSPGAVYQCGVQDARCHDQLVLDPSGNDINRVNNFRFKNKKDNGWVGGSIAVQKSPGNPMVVCAPRWKQDFTDGKRNQYYFMNGMCYWTEGDSKRASRASLIYPLSGTKNGETIPAKPGHNETMAYYNAYGEAGLSIHFTEYGGLLLIGAPGIFEWAGSIAFLSNGTRGTESFRIPNPKYTSKQETLGYFGFAVSSGRFFTKPTGAVETLFVGGAPRAGELRGKVFVFGLPPRENQSLDIRVEKIGEQLGEYFGSSLCVVDLNSDGLDDLLVGAPHYSLREPGRSSYDEGRVYVFLSLDQGRLKEVTGDSKLMGDVEFGAHFGTALASLGDINKDGYPDIAVGAPYEGKDRSGAIYIYHGVAKGINTKYSQRIFGRDINKSIRGFGISISNVMDVDGNGYSDVAVGAHMSDHAVLLRSMPVATLQAELTADVNRISINATSFQVASCISYNGDSLPPVVDVRCVLTVDTVMSIAYFSGVGGEESNKHTADVQVYKNISTCNNFTINLKHGKKDFSKPVDIKLEFSVMDVVEPNRRKRSPYEDFCKVCPVVDPDQPTSVTLRVPFATGCGEEDICRTDLRLHAQLVSDEKTLVLGKQRAVSVAVTVENRLEPAFLTRVLLEAPRFLVLARMPSSCHEDSSPSLLRLDCDIANPLTHRDGLRNITVELDTVNIPGDTTQLVFNVTAISAGQEQLPADNDNILKLDVRTQSEIRLTGTTSEDTSFFRKTAKGDEEMTAVHFYEVRNYGPSIVDSLQLKFRVPIALFTAGKNITFNKLFVPKASLGDQPFICSSSDYEFSVDSSAWGGGALDSSLPTYDRRRRSTDTMEEGEEADNSTLLLDCSQQHVVCSTVTCANVGPFRSVQTSAIVQLHMSLKLPDLVPILDKRDVIVLSTSGIVSYERLPNSLPLSTKSSMEKVVKTTLRAEAASEGLKLWVLIVAIVSGILLLLLLVLGLVKLGFFRRSKKEELDSLKSKIELECDEDESGADEAL